MAAQCSAVVPSPCASLTSTPFFRSARTDSRSPSAAAFATAAGPVATASPAEVPLCSSAARRRAFAIGDPSIDALTPTEIATASPRDAISLRICVCAFCAFCGLLRRGRCGLHRRQIDGARAVAERREIAEADSLQCRQHGVGHRRALAGLDVQSALERAAGLAGEEQRAALVIVD